MGKHCDQIDECLLLKCIHGKCLTGKGCICESGYNGTNCEKILPKNVSHLTTKKSNLSPDTIKLGFYQKIFNTTTGAALNSTSSSKIVTSTTTFKDKISSTTSSTTISSTTMTTSTTATKTTKTTSKVYTKMSSAYSTVLKQTMLYPSLPTTHKNNLLVEDFLTTTQPITSCKNGGLLIDNICICLNQFTGPRCNIKFNLFFLVKFLD